LHSGQVFSIIISALLGEPSGAHAALLELEWRAEIERYRQQSMDRVKTRAQVRRATHP
jgi:hypothetical protein